MEITNTKKTLTEVSKGIGIGLLLVSFYGIGVCIYKIQNKNKMITKIKEYNNEKNQNKENTSSNAQDNYETIYGYVYKKGDNEKSKFLKRNLGYEKKITEALNKEEVYNELKSKYCIAITEIKKTDIEMMPGTNISFKQATYTQVDDAYKEYFQEIAQIKQAVSSAMENKDIEKETGCRYKSTRWQRINNLNYRLKNFL